MPSDLDTLRRMHAAQGFGYPLPDLSSPMFVSKLVLDENEEDDEHGDDTLKNGDTDGTSTFGSRRNG